MLTDDRGGYHRRPTNTLALRHTPRLLVSGNGSQISRLRIRQGPSKTWRGRCRVVQDGQGHAKLTIQDAARVAGAAPASSSTHSHHVQNPSRSNRNQHRHRRQHPHGALSISGLKVLLVVSTLTTAAFLPSSRGEEKLHPRTSCGRAVPSLDMKLLVRKNTSTSQVQLLACSNM